jgi:uncharacterized protein (DUF2236 family)
MFCRVVRDAIKQRIVDDYVAATGKHDQPSIYGGPPGDPGLIGPGSVSWELHSDPSAIAIAGTGAIVMEILHPSVMAGVHDQSNYREDPFRRSRTTYQYVVATTFGNTTAATRLIERVKRMHTRVNGVRPDGVEYQALDPELIGWVHTCIPWAIMTAFERYNRPLSADEKARYLSEQAVIGRMSGAGEIPETPAELTAYVAAMRPKLAVNEQTRTFFDFLLNSPFGPKLPGPLARRVNHFQTTAGMTLMPRWAQELTGFAAWDPARRALHEPLLRSYTRSVRWAFGTPPFAALAQERVAAGVQAPGEPRKLAA